MNVTLERIRNEAKALSAEDRELLLVALEYDLHGDALQNEETEVDAAWENEIAGRISDVKEGKIELVSTESVDSAMDEVFAKHGIERTQRFE